MRDNKWARLLAYITGTVNERLLLQSEYLAVPANTQQDDHVFEMSSTEQCRPPSGHIPYQICPAGFATEPPPEEALDFPSN
jgi:hypothetical protein